MPKYFLTNTSRALSALLLPIEFVHSSHLLIKKVKSRISKNELSFVPTCCLQMMNIKTDKLSDVAYNFLVGEDGRVYEGRGWNSLAHFPTSSAIDNLGKPWLCIHYV